MASVELVVIFCVVRPRYLSPKIERDQTSRIQSSTIGYSAMSVQYALRDRTGWKRVRLTPGTMTAISIRPTARPRNEVCMIFFGSKTTCPLARLCAVHAATFFSLSIASVLMNHLDDSTFASVIRPNTMGSVEVGSECEREVSVKNDSESKTVGD